jgi:hypothetical protein
MHGITDGDLYSQSSVQQHQLGSMYVDPFGDAWRYTKVGASNISAGKLQIAPAQKPNHHNCAATAVVAAGQKKVTVTLGATAAVLNEYQEGWFIANDNSPEGETYRVSSHPAADSAATLEVTLDRPLLSAVATSSEFTLVHNAWNKVVEGTTITIRAAGVPMLDMTAGYFGFLKTRGVASVLIGSAATLGADLIVGGTAGAVTDRTDALGASSEPVVAVADIVLGVTGEYNPVRLCID